MQLLLIFPTPIRLNRTETLQSSAYLYSNLPRHLFHHKQTEPATAAMPPKKSNATRATKLTKPAALPTRARLPRAAKSKAKADAESKDAKLVPVAKTIRFRRQSGIGRVKKVESLAQRSVPVYGPPCGCSIKSYTDSSSCTLGPDYKPFRSTTGFSRRDLTTMIDNEIENVHIDCPQCDLIVRHGLPIPLPFALKAECKCTSPQLQAKALRANPTRGIHPGYSRSFNEAGYESAIREKRLLLEEITDIAFEDVFVAGENGLGGVTPAGLGGLKNQVLKSRHTSPKSIKKGSRSRKKEQKKRVGFSSPANNEGGGGSEDG
ncbi:hypothetical protein BKA65DRAFT_509304 [Rhexocercosporidium sp. MPI-PUGE-AT-0058]|nr:hypothetical protein BKA65DRAFT_509304 [Rhexocercosporidium sp. MPI-PUGE-AT-0058]